MRSCNRVIGKRVHLSDAGLVPSHLNEPPGAVIPLSSSNYANGGLTFYFLSLFLLPLKGYVRSSRRRINALQPPEEGLDDVYANLNLVKYST